MLERRKEYKGEKADGKIYDLFFSSPLVRAESFFVYYSFGSEIRTKELIEELLARKKKICLPKTVKGKMLSVPYAAGAPLIKDDSNILCPQGEEDVACEVAITPLLGFDRQGYRLGYGGGYYDRYFAANPTVFSVGLAYSVLEERKIPHADHDAKIDCVITEKEIIPLSDRAKKLLAKNCL